MKKDNILEEAEVEAASRFIKNEKVAGLGDLTIELIRHVTTRTLELICRIFNNRIEGEDMPRDWRTSHIKSIYIKKVEKYARITIKEI